MSNRVYVDAFGGVRDGYKRPHTVALDEVEILLVGGVGKREVVTILSCEGFNDMTARGSVVVTEEHGIFLKVTGQHWVTVNRFGAEGIRHDADVLLALVLEQDRVNVLIDPCREACVEYVASSTP